MGKKKSKVFVAMSGGVDSSVAALLLKKQGYDCVGVFMRCYNLDGCSERDSEDARRVAEHIGIPFYVFNFEEEYKKRVVEYMVEGYRAGITPNPDVVCNREIKFGLFLEKALALGADYIATGHYVKLCRDAKLRMHANLQKEKEFVDSNKFVVSHRLYQAKDLNKDQSYFLWTLTQAQLRHCLFPVGDYLKSEVREIARKAKLPTAEKKDSQGICFLGNVLLMDFLKQYLPEREGAVLTTEGKKIGEHEGAHFYTIGQRHGFAVQRAKSKEQRVGCKGRSAEPTKPHYIVEKDVATNMVIVAEGSENPALYKKEVVLADVHFISPKNHFLIRANKKVVPMKVLARVRYRQPLEKATLVMGNEQGVNGKSKLPISHYQLLFSRPVKFIAPGQSAVFYLPRHSHAEEGSGLEMLGGGVILQ